MFCKVEIGFLGWLSAVSGLCMYRILQDVNVVSLESLIKVDLEFIVPFIFDGLFLNFKC